MIAVSSKKNYGSRNLMVPAALVVALAVTLLGVVATSSGAAAGDTTRVSLTSSGAQANGDSDGPFMSADGRLVVFSSSAPNLVPRDTNGETDIFVRDRSTGTTERVSVDSSGIQPNGSSGHPSVSADGRFVAFSSRASNLVPDDTNGIADGTPDVFVRDRQTGTTERVSVDSSGNQANSSSCCLPPSISSDGRSFAFQSYASNLVPGDTNNSMDSFVHEFVVDTRAPKVVGVAPARGATGIGTSRDVKATFSERVYNVKANFVLYRKGSSTPVGAVVHSVAGTSGTKWVLNPNNPLRAGTTYVAKVKTGVVDKVGNILDQDPTLSGDQPRTWTFKTRR
jgi:hypothetical protein